MVNAAFDVLQTPPSPLPCAREPSGTSSERQDNEIAQEIQDQLVRQAEHQRQQEEKDAVRNAHFPRFRQAHSVLRACQCAAVGESFHVNRPFVPASRFL